MLRPRGRPRINLEFRKLVSGITKKGHFKNWAKKIGTKIGPKNYGVAGHKAWPKTHFNGHVICMCQFSWIYIIAPLELSRQNHNSSLSSIYPIWPNPISSTTTIFLALNCSLKIVLFTYLWSTQDALRRDINSLARGRRFRQVGFSRKGMNFVPFML